MLELVAQLLTLSFATKLCSAFNGPPSLTPLTAGYLVLLAAAGVLSHAELLPAELLGFDSRLVFEELQVWRVISAFLWAEGIGTSFALQLWFFAVYSSLLESRFVAAGRPYAVALGAGVLQLLAFEAALGMGVNASLAQPLCFYAITLWSRAEPQRSFELFQTGSMQAAFVPWSLLACFVPLTGVHCAMHNLLGIWAALAYDLAFGLPPSPADAPSIASSSSRRTYNGGRLTKSMTKPAAGGRERWLRWAYVAAVALLVGYHATARAAERTNEHSPQMLTCKRLRDAMDRSKPEVLAAVTKFSEARRAVTADAATILGAWTFAVEHWQQANAQKDSPTNVNNMSFADPEVTRQVVAQALGRTDVPESMADTDLVTEVYSAIGLARLFVTPEAKPYFVTAVNAFRLHRLRTAAAWVTIKKFVLPDGEGDVDGTASADERAAAPEAEATEADTVREVHAAVNTSLSEYDLPSHMTDQSVLAELFGLLDLPRDAVTHRTERVLLAAIYQHRAERAVAAARSLDGVLFKVADAMRSHANGASSSVHAINQTLLTLVPEALSLMDLPAAATEDEALASFAERANLTMDEAEAVRAESLEKPLLSSVLLEVRARRAADASAQARFEELIATVRAEDPTLAADETRKRLATERYEEKRLRFVMVVLQHAATAGSAKVAAVAQEALQTDGLALLNASEASGNGAIGASTEGEGMAEEVEEEWAEAVDNELRHVAQLAEELGTLRTKMLQRERVLLSPSEQADSRKHEHYARLLKLPRLIDETLTTWIDPADDLSDKQVFQELLRLMGLPETVEPQLMRAMVEAVKQHRLRREREEIERGDWASLGAEPLALRTQWRLAHPAVRPFGTYVNVGGSGNEFALFLATLLNAIGAHVRLSIGCSDNVTISGGSPATDGVGRSCQMATEVRLGRNPSKLTPWVRTWLTGSRWLGKTYHYRLDREGYVWLNLDWVDGSRLQRPGVPFKSFDSLTTYYPSSLTWEVEGEELDSAGVPRPGHSPIESLHMGLR